MLTEVPVVTTAVRNLGAWFNCNLIFYYHLHNIRQIGNFLTYDSTKLLVQAVIMARIDYCNGLLYRVATVHLEKLQRLQNTAAQLIIYTLRFHHISPVLLTLHWLPVKCRTSYKIAVLTFKVIHFSTPAYLRDLLQFRHNERYSLRSMRGIAERSFSKI